ncbi:MAG: HAD hydrolase family protein [Thermoproteus sp.]
MSIALFADLDGTLVPPELMRRDPSLPLELEYALRELAHRIPFAVVTTKECGLAARAVPFAAAYACVNGIEVRAGGYVAIAEGLKSAELDRVLRSAGTLDALVEAKRTWDGRLAGVTIDWRERGVPPRGLEQVLNTAASLGLKVVRYSRHPFVDIYGADVDKGRAVRLLKALLGVEHVVYMGDSENDLPAWAEADVRIVVRHALNRDLPVEGAVPIAYEELPRYVRQVLANLESAK